MFVPWHRAWGCGQTEIRQQYSAPLLIFFPNLNSHTEFNFPRGPLAYAPRFCCGPLDFSEEGPEIVYIYYNIEILFLTTKSIKRPFRAPSLKSKCQTLAHCAHFWTNMVTSFYVAQILEFLLSSLFLLYCGQVITNKLEVVEYIPEHPAKKNIKSTYGSIILRPFTSWAYKWS